MNYHLFDNDYTWETEDCELKLAEYFVCERHIQKVSVIEENYLPRKSEWIYIPAALIDGYYVDSFKDFFKYNGTVNTTYSGKSCQRWDKNIPHSQTAYGYQFPEDELVTANAANYCRDPYDNGYLWCFTTDPRTRWEPCILKDKKKDGHGIAYKRFQKVLNHTYTGKSCQLWNEQFVASDQSLYSDVIFEDNNCRDPFDQGFIWCFISGGGWEPCDANEAYLNQSEINDQFGYITNDELFTCTDGQNISMIRKCDAKFDCMDYSDEANCWRNINLQELAPGMKISSNIPFGFENGSYFCCNRTLEWISITEFCDGVVDCLDVSDEINCNHSVGGKENGSFIQCTKQIF
ncbi:plasminogen-like [Mercenaria mercenaria]|uniref:plasminogen-like n=1 Tax=Mercenaria mercenaria TaxID=6596 RepID=UPI00234EFE89|nr:plasminogen-like [Mercenaria mercenaria]